MNVHATEGVLSFVEMEELGDSDCGFDAHFSSVDVAWALGRLGLDVAFGDPRAVGVDDGLVVLHAGLHVSTSQSVLGLDWLTGEVEYGAKQGRLCCRDRSAELQEGWLSILGVGRWCSRSSPVGCVLRHGSIHNWAR